MKRFLAALMCLCLVVCMLPAQVFAADTELTISFADTANRTTFNASQQVWEQNGIVVTNNKTATSSEVADKSNPARFYAGSDLIIAVPGQKMTQISIYTTGSSYSAAYVNTVTENAVGGVSAVADGTTVVISFAEPVESVTLTGLKAQARAGTMTVTLVPAAGGDTEEPGEGTIETEPSSSETEPSSSETEPSSSETTPSESTPAVEPGETTELTISFADKANRTELISSSKQVWQQNGVTVTNNKGSYNQALGDYANPARFYAGTELIISAPGYKISKVVVNANTTAYATVMKTSADNAGLSTSVDSKAVTITLSEAVETLPTISMSAQVRVDSIVVTVAKVSDAPVVPEVPTAPSAESAAYAFSEAYADFAADAALPATFLYKEFTFNVAWTVESTNAAAAYIEEGVLKIVPQTAYASYKLTATISLDADSATVSYNGAVKGTEYASEATITFDEAKTGRVELNSDKQVWIQNNITFTNNKAEATASVADRTAPVRLYKNSEFVVEYPAMWSIVFDCNTSAYAEALEASVDAAAVQSVARDADKVTVTFKDAADSFTVAALSAATWVDSITVSQVEPETPVDPDPDVPVDPDPDVPVDPDVATEETLSFADTTSRLEQTTEIQVWQNNALTLTNNKASSTSDIIDSSNPVRLYKNSDIIVEYPAMMSITFDCTTAEYAANLKAAIGETATVSGDIVVVNFAEPTNSYTLVLTGGQVRLDSMTVSQNAAVAPEAPVIPDPEEISIVDANALGLTMAHNTYTEGMYYVTGVVNAIANATYGNLYIADADGNLFYIYGLYNADGTVRYDKMDPQPKVGDTITVLGAIGNYSGNAQMKNGWVTAYTAGEGEPEEPVIPDPVESTIADVNELAMTTPSDVYSAGQYIVIGKVILVENGTYGNLYIEDEAGDQLYIYGLYNADGTVRYDAMDPKPVEGDTITVMGVIGNHNGKPQMKNGCVTAYTAGEGETEAEVLTINQFLAKCAEGGANYTTKKYTVTGQIVEIKQNYYGNLTIQDEEGDTLYIYGNYNADGSVQFGKMDIVPKVGDIITVTGVAGQYTDASGVTTNQMKNGWIQEHQVAVAQVADVYYFNLADAIAAAGADATITLIGNATEAALEIPAGITVDLAGFTITAESVASFGQIVDSSDAKGGIVAANFEATGNAMLPLADNGTYRFFAYELNALGSKTAKAGAKFGFAINFANAKAYELIAGAEDVGVTVSMALTCGETTATYAFDAALVKAYAALHIANPGRQAAMILTVTGLENMEAGTVVSVVASVAAAGNVNVSADAMTYTK